MSTPRCRSWSLSAALAAILRAALAAAPLVLGACLFQFPTSDAGTGDGGARGDAGYGYGRPTLELTINGVHFGPSAPDSSSGASYVVTRDSRTGRVTGSTFRVVASSSATGATCELTAQRTGDGIAPIGVGSYSVASSSLGPTRDGTVAPIAGEAVAVPQGAWQCTGSRCDGAVFSLIGLDARHAEGFFAGVMQNTRGAPDAQVVCSFHVPMAAFQP